MGSAIHGMPGYLEAPVIRLGEKTKSGRPQTVIFRAGEAPELLQRLRLLSLRTPTGMPLISISYNKYRLLFQLVSQRLGIAERMLPHSPRAGYATDASALGLSVSDIMKEGRWSKEATCTN